MDADTDAQASPNEESAHQGTERPLPGPRDDHDGDRPSPGAGHDRPRPSPGPDAAADDDTDVTNGSAADTATNETSPATSEGSSSGSGDGSSGGSGEFTYGDADDGQEYVDRDAVDFDPEDGLYTGSAIDGGSDIPGPSEADIREAQEDSGEQGSNAGEKKAAEKFIEENDVDLEQAQKGEAIAGSAQTDGSKGDDQ